MARGNELEVDKTSWFFLLDLGDLLLLVLLVKTTWYGWRWSCFEVIVRKGARKGVMLI